MKICIVDDHDIVREGLRQALGNDPAIEVVGEGASGSQALQEARRTLPDVMVVDYRLPDMTGAELCKRIRAGFPSTSVVMLTTYLSEEVVQQSVEAGAAAFVTKAAGLSELREVLARIAAGDDGPLVEGASAVVQRLHASEPERTPMRSLTPRQERVLELAAQGLTYSEISSRLHISESTVRFHIQQLKARFGVKTKAELLTTAIRSALIDPDGTNPAD